MTRNVKLVTAIRLERNISTSRKQLEQQLLITRWSAQSTVDSTVSYPSDSLASCFVRRTV